MTKQVTIEWTEVARYEQTFTVPEDWQPETPEGYADPLVEVICEQADYSNVAEVCEREIDRWEVVPAG